MFSFLLGWYLLRYKLHSAPFHWMLETMANYTILLTALAVFLLADQDSFVNGKYYNGTDGGCAGGSGSGGGSSNGGDGDGKGSGMS